MQDRRKRKPRVFGSRALRRRRHLMAAIALALVAIALCLFLWGRGAGWFDMKAPSPTPTATTETPAPEAESPAPETAEPTPDQAVPANPMVGRAIARASSEDGGIDATQTGTPGSAPLPGVSLSPTPIASPSPAAQPTPTGPLGGVKIGIDPGHQAKANNEQELVSPDGTQTKAKVSSGTAGVTTRVAEYVVNLDISLQLRSALEALGAQVYMTRESHEVDISNIERAQMMNEHGVDLVLRIHCNGSEDRSVHGISLFVKPTGAGAQESLRAAEALLPAMVQATQARSLGIFQRDTYSGLNWSEVPSILVEMGFMSNPEEDLLLSDPAYQQKLVAGMVQGVADYMERALEEAPAAGEAETTPPPSAAAGE